MVELDQVGLERLTQALVPTDPQNLQLVMRVLALQSTPTIYKGGGTYELSTAAMDFATAFEGPWEAATIALKFLKPVIGHPGTFEESNDPKTFWIGMRLAGENFKLIEEVDYIGTQYVLDGPFLLGAEDQIVVGCEGTDQAKLQIRGKKL